MPRPPAKIENFRNRVVGSGVERVDQLVANPNNFRVHPDSQQQALAGAIDEIGFARSILVNKTTGNVIDGHARITIAMRSGVEELPVEYVELSEDEEKKALLFLDPISAMAASDKTKLDELMQQVQSDDERVQEMIAGLAEREGIAYGAEPPEDVEPQIDKAEELRVKWGVELGQLWRLGDHLIICGDCTDKAVVERVMDGEKAELVWTDPPYGVNYGAKLDASNPMGYRVRSIENDDLPPDKLEDFIRSSLKLCAEYSVPGCSVYVACPPGTLLPILIASFIGSGFVFHWGLVWLKDQLVLGRGDYHFKHENILYGWKEDAAHYFIDDRKQTSVFEYSRPKSSEMHPTMKPVELVERMIQNSSRADGIVAEPFSGSGTTIIACERLKRKCRAIEISPGYVAVAIQRWVDVSGGTPELIYNGESTNG